MNLKLCGQFAQSVFVGVTGRASEIIEANMAALNRLHPAVHLNVTVKHTIILMPI